MNRHIGIKTGSTLTWDKTLCGRHTHEVEDYTILVWNSCLEEYEWDYKPTCDACILLMMSVVDRTLLVCHCDYCASGNSNIEPS